MRDCIYKPEFHFQITSIFERHNEPGQSYQQQQCIVQNGQLLHTKIIQNNESEKKI